MADPIGWIAEGKPAENEAFMVFGKRTEYACVPVYRAGCAYRRRIGNCFDTGCGGVADPGVRRDRCPICQQRILIVGEANG